MKVLMKCRIADLMRDSGNLVRDSGNLVKDLAKEKTKKRYPNQLHGGRGRREPELIEQEIWLLPGEPGSRINRASPEVVCA